MTKKKKPDSVFKEAWDNMSGDFNNLLPEKMRARQGKKKFVLWLFILEILVLAGIGKLLYEWLKG